MLLTEQSIRDEAKAAKSVGDFINRVHRLVHPDFDKIEKLEGYVTCNAATSEFIVATAFEEAKRWKDHTKHSLSVHLAWMNWGFSTLESESLAYLEVIPVPAEKIKYKA